MNTADNHPIIPGMRAFAAFGPKVEPGTLYGIAPYKDSGRVIFVPDRIDKADPHLVVTITARYYEALPSAIYADYNKAVESHGDLREQYERLGKQYECLALDRDSIDHDYHELLAVVFGDDDDDLDVWEPKEKLREASRAVKELKEYKEDAEPMIDLFRAMLRRGIEKNG